MIVRDVSVYFIVITIDSLKINYHDFYQLSLAPAYLHINIYALTLVRLVLHCPQA